MLSDVLNEIKHDITVPKLVVILIGYGITHGTYSLLSHLEKSIAKEATSLVRHRHQARVRAEAYQDLL